MKRSSSDGQWQVSNITSTHTADCLQFHSRTTIPQDASSVGPSQFLAVTDFAAPPIPLPPGPSSHDPHQHPHPHHPHPHPHSTEIPTGLAEYVESSHSHSHSHPHSPRTVLGAALAEVEVDGPVERVSPPPHPFAPFVDSPQKQGREQRYGGSPPAKRQRLMELQEEHFTNRSDLARFFATLNLIEKEDVDLDALVERCRCKLDDLLDVCEDRECFELAVGYNDPTNNGAYKCALSPRAKALALKKLRDIRRMNGVNVAVAEE
ncbi:hypothetical protein BT69DRAFT_1278035 [Atractiella rhizophila]|nr:hypothetical protein BT69DRAFT_1278035 [Atractiella rhizophila]